MIQTSLLQLKTQLELRGFVVESDYEYSRQLSTGKVVRESVDLAGFLQPDRRDLSTLAVIVRLFSNLPKKYPFDSTNRYLPAPVQIALTSDYMQLWTPRERIKPVRITHISNVASDFDRFRISISELQRVKEGFQESLFSLLPDALDFAREATSRLVTEQFNKALLAVRKNNGLSKLTALGLDLLAAIILDDKRDEIGRYNEEISANNPIEVLTRARRYFPLSFNDVPRVSDDIIDTFWRHLRSDMTYRALSPDDISDLLSALYEGVLLSKTQRKFQGSFYTPRSFASKLLLHMPIEEIPPDERIVLDGACGSGNLLRAASNRLRGLLPKNTSRREQSIYLSKRLLGVDKDEFAVNIARKALLMANLPYDSHWQVISGDFIDANVSGEPSIIIANPPFIGIKSRGGGEYAVNFIVKYLEVLRPGGLLGILLPAPLMQNPSEAAFRRDLIEYCELMELWMMPEKTISSSQLGITALILKKRPDRTSEPFPNTRVFTAHTLNAKDAFLNGQGVSLSFVTRLSRYVDDETRLIPSVLGDLWMRLKYTCPSLQKRGYEVVNGVQGSIENFSATPGDGWRRCLSFASSLEPYSIDWDSQTRQKFVNYPGRLKRPRKPEHFSFSTKVVIQGERNPGSPWRLIAAVDYEQLVIKESFHYIIPVEEKTIPDEVIAAVLNSKVANAWYSEQDVQFHVQNVLVQRLPFPNFTSAQQQKIKTLVNEITEISHKKGSEPNTASILTEIVREIDNIIANAYGLSEGEIALVNLLMQRDVRPSAGGVYSSSHLAVNSLEELSYKGGVYFANGLVISVDYDTRKVTLEFAGVTTNPIRLSIPPTMPGWALRKGVAFSVEIPEQQLDEISPLLEVEDGEIIDIDNLAMYNFAPSRNAYMSDEELVRHVALFQ